MVPCWRPCRVMPRSTKRPRGRAEIAKLPTVIHGTKGTLADRETIIGVVRNGAARAYPLSKLTVQSPVVLDSVGGEPIMLVLGPDGKSVRVFSRKMGGNTLEFYSRSAANWKPMGACSNLLRSANGVSMDVP